MRSFKGLTLMHTISWGHIAGGINLLDNVALVFYIMLKNHFLGLVRASTEKHYLPFPRPDFKISKI